MKVRRDDAFDPMTARPVSSLIVATKNGGFRLEKCLNHLQRLQSIEQVEIIVVDNGSTDASADLMTRFAARRPSVDKVISEAIAGNSAGRNRGIRAARTDLLLFTDDDCYVNSTFVTDWLSVFSKSSRLGYASGRILPFEPNNSLLGCEVSDVTEAVGAHSFFRRGFVQGSNMAFRRSCLEAAGFFDPAFGAGALYAGEEWDLALRASFAGWEGGYFPTPTVAHDHGRSGRDSEERLRFYDYGAGAVYAKHAGTAHGWQARRKFAGDLWRSRSSMGRAHAMLAGYLDYRRSAGRRKAT